MLPDIDLDFPRAIRDELIRRVHEHFGPEFAVLTGAIATYSVKGIIQDLGKALGLPKEDLRLLSRQLHSLDAADLRGEMMSLPAFRDRVEAPGWRDLVELAPQLMHAPRSLGQHVGGMILSDTPSRRWCPSARAAMDGRFIMDWNKDSVADANFAKIDLLSLPVLDQLEEALDLIEVREGWRPDLSKLDPRTRRVRHDQRGQVQGHLPAPVARAAQDGTAPALPQPPRPRLPGGAHPARRRRAGERGEPVRGAATGMASRGTTTIHWSSGRWSGGIGIIVWQEQVVQLLVDVAG